MAQAQPPTSKLFKLQTNRLPLASYEHWCFHFGYFIGTIRGFTIYFPRKEFDYGNQRLLNLSMGSKVLDEGLYS